MHLVIVGGALLHLRGFLLFPRSVVVHSEGIQYSDYFKCFILSWGGGAEPPAHLVLTPVQLLQIILCIHVILCSVNNIKC